MLRSRFAPFPLLVILASCTQSDPVRIGLAGPFGEARGFAMRAAAELAVAQLNEAGGLRGRPVELVVFDDSASAERAVRVARQLASDPDVVGVIGHLTSGATLAAAPVYGGVEPVVAISPSASSPLLTAAGPWIFRVCPTDELHGARLAAWAFDQGARRVAVLYQNDAYGRGVRAEFTTAFTASGGAVVADDPYLDDLPSFGPYLERLRILGGADALFVAGTRAGAERILATLDSMNLRLPVLAGDGVIGIESGSVLAEGMTVSTAYLPDRPGEENAAFVRAYAERTGGRLPDHRGAGAYDAVRLLAAAVEAVGTDRTRIRDYLAGVGTREPPFEGVTGRIAFDESGDVPDKDIVIGVVRGGVLRTAGGS